MRPLLPQPNYSFRVLLKWVVIYGFMVFVILLCVTVFKHANFELYWRNYKFLGMAGAIEYINYDFGGWNSSFLRGIRQLSPLIMFLPFGAGGILGVMHYIFVRRRRSIIMDMGESSAVDDDGGSTK